MNAIIGSMKHMLAAVAVMLVCVGADAQNLWMFNKNNYSKFDKTWTQEHYAPATQAGAGRVTARDAQGNDMAEYRAAQSAIMAGPFKAGDCFYIDVPAEKVPAGSFVDFNATVAIENGAPMDWILEVKDGGEWRKGKTFRCYGPLSGSAHKHTCVYQTFKLENASDGMVSFRIRALDGYVRPPKGGERDGMAAFISGAYLGVMVNDLGTETPADTLKVLAIGNSFTYYCGCPTMLKEIAWKEGHFIDIHATLKGGMTMGRHLSIQTTNDMVAEGEYDYMILQDQSLIPAKVGRDPKGMHQQINDMAAMAAKVRTTSPECKAIVENTWAYWKYDLGGFKSLEDFDKNGKKGAKILAKAVEDAQVSPIGQAFKIVRAERPDINLYSSDKHHQSVLGSYLKSCVNYLVLYKKPFGDSPSDCLQDPEVAAYLRSVAERVVLK